MSEQTNTALIEKMYAAFNKGDIETVLANLAPDAEWVDYGPDAVPYLGDFRGRVPDFFRAIAESTSRAKVDVHRYFASSDVVVAEGRYTGTVRENGAAIDQPFAHVFTLLNGKVTSWRGYGDTAALVASHTAKAAFA